MFRDEIMVETSIGKWNEKTFVVNHVIYNKGRKSVEGEETRVWALRHPDDPTRLKAGIIPPEIIKAFE
jgi:4-hydroxybenzoyl-CoA thioesterase